MNSNNVTPDLETIRRNAGDWFARLRSPRATDKEVREFEDWLVQDPRHREEFEYIDQLWLQCGDLRKLAQHDAAQELPHSTVVPIPARRLDDRPRRMQHWAVAALLVIGLGVGWILVDSSVTSPSAIAPLSDTQTLSTLRGEQKSVDLQDGTKLTLNTQTIIKVNYTSRERRVILLRGQALFDIARDKDRPFVVDVEQGTVRALGTVFDIYRTPQSARITLLEGAIEVATNRPVSMQQHSTGTSKSVQLAPGQQVSLTNDGQISDPIPVSLQQITAWQTGKLKFDETPLVEVIAQSNRYSDQQMFLGDPELAGALVTGVFNVAQTDDLAKALQQFLGLKITQDASGNLLIERPEY